ncbi:MAG: methionine--tRNA ligase [Epsilonproteobacteria bacterium]|nr:methionine--tRNA ligase [Campylobacterota bacterium]
MKKNKFYVTTPIYYVTAAPHLGSLYSTLLADVSARYHQLAGQDVFFLTGTDEHGQKIAQAAEKAGKQPQEFVDGFIPSYQEMWKRYNIAYSKFIRTTDQEHIVGVQQWLQRLIDQGDVYKDFYKGFYCTPCETFVTEKDQDKQGADVMCPSCGRATTEVSEECYFFKLSAYQDKLLQFFEQHPDFITPKERLQEVISFVKEGLKDLSISRKTITWGIPFPGDNTHVTYVWADALNNYLTGIGYGTNEASLHTWWPADLQILGKDIVRFHAIYWPAFLMASGLKLPKKLLVHGWIKVDDRKMSKSLGNAVDPKQLANNYGVDEIRYYLTRKMAITQDSEFRISDIEQSINSELANDLGNLLNRCSTLALKNNLSMIEPPKQWSDKSKVLHQECITMIQESRKLVEQGYLYRAVNRIWEYINKANAYFHEQEPWKQARSNQDEFAETIAATVYSLHSIGAMLWPVMPTKMELMLSSLGFEWHKSDDMFVHLQKSAWTVSCTIKKIETLFQKIEITKESNVEETKVEQKIEEKKESYLQFEDFLKVDMRVGTITACDEIEGSDKLLKMQVDFGDLGQRQILAGIKKSFTPDDLVGTQGIFVVNLKPRKMMGIPSEGMMLVASDAQGLQRMIPAGDITPGSKVG